MNRCKMLAVLFFVLGLLSATLYGSGTITELYYKDYGHVNRTVIVTTEKPSYGILELQEGKQIVITIDKGRKNASLPTKLDYESSFIESAVIDESIRDKIRIIIQVNRSFYIETFSLNGKRNRVVVDIFTKKTPTSIEEKASFADFYVTVGYHDRALPVINEVRKTNSQYTGINYYWGKMLLDKGEVKSAIEKFKLVGLNQKEYPLALIELEKQGISPQIGDSRAEKLYLDYVDYFRRAKDENQQQFITAWVSGLYGNKEETKKLFQSVNYKDKDIESFLQNIESMGETMATDGHIKLPSLTQTKPERPKTEGLANMLINVVALIVVIFLIVFIIVMRKRIKRLEFEAQLDVISDADREITAYFKRSQETEVEMEPAGEKLSESLLEETQEITQEAVEEEIDDIIEEELPVFEEPESLPEETQEIAQEAVEEETEEQEKNDRLPEKLDKPLDDLLLDLDVSETDDIQQPVEPDGEIKETRELEEAEEITETTIDATEDEDEEEVEDGVAAIENQELRQDIAKKLYDQGWTVFSISRELSITEAEVKRLLGKS